MFGRRHESWTARGVRCPGCAVDLIARRGCLRVTLRCPCCGTHYDLLQLSDQLTEDFEEDLGDVPMDRV